MTTNEKFAEFVTSPVVSELAPPPPPPLVTYDPDGDCIEVLFPSHESYWGQRVGPGVTIYLAQESCFVVGMLIEGISRIMAQSARPNKEQDNKLPLTPHLT